MPLPSQKDGNMTDSDSKFSGSIPELYDRLMVPMIFADYARELAAQVAKTAPRDVIEIAAGTGAVTRALAPLLAADSRLTVTDLNPGMLERCRQLQPEDPRLTWATADAMNLPFDDDSFDAAVCQFGVMFLPDRAAGFAEIRRVLRPQGQFHFNVWDRIETSAFTACVTDALAGMFPDDPPRFMARTPHGYHDADRIRQDVLAGGFKDVGIEIVDHDSPAASARDVATAFCQGTPLRNEILARGDLYAATDLAEKAVLARFGSGPLTGSIRALVVTATQ
jgi:ubiquinone/menaquinone biosynthesis C-methylase UbiE